MLKLAFYKILISFFFFSHIPSVKGPTGQVPSLFQHGRGAVEDGEPGGGCQGLPEAAQSGETVK